MRFRIGSVPYLNGEPLAAALRQPDLFPEVERVDAVPARLLDELLAGRLDAALVSTAGVLSHPELRIVPGFGVISRGAVRSVQLFGRTALRFAQSIALDASSRCAVVLTRLLFRAVYEREPEYRTSPPDLATMLSECEMALLIGNPCLRAVATLDRGEWAGPPLTRYDLGAEWQAWTGLPFVWAVWAARADSDLGALREVLTRAAEWGLARRAELARTHADAAGIGASEAHCYLTETIRYALDEQAMAGMLRFCTLARRLGLLPPTAEVRLAGCAALPR